jgi:hypothetical protein
MPMDLNVDIIRNEDKKMNKVLGVGIYNRGEYKAKENGKHTNEYACWHSMLQRCYDPKYQAKYPTYIGCTVYDEWLYFQNFAEWYNENYYEIPLLGKSQIDKDILVKGNKIYSPDTCVFVPGRVNSLFIKCDAARGEFPIGVYYAKRAKKFHARIRYGDGKNHHLGYFTSVEEAFEVYKVAKEKYIKEVAETYRAFLPKVLYDVMLEYEVDFND